MEPDRISKSRRNVVGDFLLPDPGIDNKGENMPEVTRDEYTRGQERIHNRIDSINDCTIRVEASSKNIEKMVTQMYNLIHGNGKEGLISKFGKLWIRATINFSLIMICLTAIIGSCFFIIREFFKQ